MEDSNQPMLIGLISPTFEIEGPHRFKSLYFVSMLYVAPGQDALDLELRFDFDGCSGECTSNSGPFYGKAMHSDEKGDFENLSVISFPLNGLEVDIDSRITAILKCGELKEEYSINFVSNDF